MTSGRAMAALGSAAVMWAAGAAQAGGMPMERGAYAPQAARQGERPQAVVDVIRSIVGGGR